MTAFNNTLSALLAAAVLLAALPAQAGQPLGPCFPTPIDHDEEDIVIVITGA